MSETVKHKRCPFCGGTGEMNRDKMVPYEKLSFAEEGDGYWYSVACLNCHSATADYFTSDAAWEAWDKRV